MKKLTALSLLSGLLFGCTTAPTVNLTDVAYDTAARKLVKETVVVVPAEHAYMPQDASRPSPLQIVYGRYEKRSFTNTVAEMNRRYNLPLFSEAGDDQIVTIVIVKDASHSFCKKLWRSMGFKREITDYHFVVGDGDSDAFICDRSLIQTSSQSSSQSVQALGPLSRLTYLDKNSPSNHTVLDALSDRQLATDELPVVVTYRQIR